MNEEQYNELSGRYGYWSSWAIWNHKDATDTGVITLCRKELNARYVLLAYNMSIELPRDRPPWRNFHGWMHYRKVMYACNDTELRGSYMTDLFKGVIAPRSNKVKDSLTDELIADNVESFRTEMAEVGADEDTTYIVFGKETAEIARMFKTHFLPHLGDVSVVYYYHYAYYRLTDRAWVEGFWDKLGIDADYNSIRAKNRPS
ncbi:MAG: hypothetical protein ACXV5K_11055 [Halobacteriota archaeon]